MELLYQLLKATEEETLHICRDTFKRLGVDFIDNPQWLYVRNPKSSFCVVAHADTVGSQPPATLTTINGVVRNPEGILGADDRAGVYAILKLLEAGHRPNILITTGEETGGVGVKAWLASNPEIEGINLFLEFDRRGINEYVYYSEYLPIQIKNWIESFGFEVSHGSYSDVADITNSTSIPHLNLSVCYFKQHTNSEYLLENYLETNIKIFGQLLRNPIDKLYKVDPPRFNKYDKYGYSATHYSGFFGEIEDFFIEKGEMPVFCDFCGVEIEYGIFCHRDNLYFCNEKCLKWAEKELFGDDLF